MCYVIGPSPVEITQVSRRSILSLMCYFRNVSGPKSIIPDFKRQPGNRSRLNRVYGFIMELVSFSLLLFKLFIISLLCKQLLILHYLTNVHIYEGISKSFEPNMERARNLDLFCFIFQRSPLPTPHTCPI